MLSGTLKGNNSNCFSNLAVAHPNYVEMGTIETKDCYICLIVEKDRLKDSVSANYWGQEISQAQYRNIRADILDWSLQSIIIECQKSDGSILIERSRQAECGLYACSKDGSLHLDWDPVRLYQYIDTSKPFLNTATTIARLELELRYSHYSIFKDIYRLPERCKMNFSGQKLTIEQPDHIDPPKAVPLKKGANPIEVFYDLIKETISRWPITPSQTGAILSSGLDTTIVCHFLKDFMNDETLKTFGYNGLDKNRDGIMAMRQETIDKLKLDDTYIDIEDHLHKAYQHNSAERHWPEESQTGFIETALAQKISEQNLDLIFTGIGGDELCMLTAEELSDMQMPQRRVKSGWDGDPNEGFEIITPEYKEQAMPLKESSWPNGYVGFSSPNMANVTSLFYLRQGIWWANPLGNAALHMFTGFLPKEYRHNRKLSRDALKNLGWSDFFITQQPKESLLETVNHMMLHAKWDKIFENSILCQAGFIDKKKLFEGIEIFKETLSMNITVKIMMALELELSLQSLAQYNLSQTKNETAKAS